MNLLFSFAGKCDTNEQDIIAYLIGKTLCLFYMLYNVTRQILLCEMWSQTKPKAV